MPDSDFHQVVAVHSMICTFGAAFCAVFGAYALKVNDRALATVATLGAMGMVALALHVH